MMYKCKNCGHLFEEGEQEVWNENYGTEIGGEMFSGCPMCRGSYEEVHQCKECGYWHTDDELYEGWCEKCLREKIDEVVFFDYIKETEDYLEHFMFTNVFGIDPPKETSDTMRNWLGIIYTIKARNEERFVDACKKYIIEDDGDFGKQNFAEWLNSKKEVK